MLSSRVPGRSYFLLLTGLRTGQGSWAKLLSQPWRWRGRAGRAGEAGPDDARPEPRSARAVSDACLCICRQVGSCCDEGFVCAQTELLTPAQERVVTLLHMVLRFVAEDTFNLCLLAGKVLPSLAVSGAAAGLVCIDGRAATALLSVLCALCSRTACDSLDE